MKKLISLLLALMMAILAIPALAEDAQDPDMAFDPDIDPDFLVGAWESWTGNPLEIPDDVKAAFDKAMEGLVGCTYEPIAILGRRLSRARITACSARPPLSRPMRLCPTHWSTSTKRWMAQRKSCAFRTLCSTRSRRKTANPPQKCAAWSNYVPCRAYYIEN